MYLAIDIGGTYIKFGVVTASGEILRKKQVRTPLTSYSALLECLNKVIDPIKNKYNINGIGLSIPAAADPKTGVVLSEGALIYIKNQNIKKDIMKLSQLNVSIENDANCAALAEIWLGAGKQCESIAFIVIGTGIGGAIIKNNQIISGKNLFAGEFGYGIHEFNYQNTSFKTWSKTGATAVLVENTAKKLNRDKDMLDGKEVFRLADNGSDKAREAIDYFYYTLAIGIHNIQHYIDPDKIIIGGGISNRKNLVNETNKRLDQLHKQLPPGAIRPMIETSAFKNDANLLGAVYTLVKEND